MPTREVVYLQDLASVEEVFKEQDSIGDLISPAIGISISKQSTANSVLVSRAVDKSLDELMENIRIKLTYLINHPIILNCSMNVAEAALLGFLAILVCFLFLEI